LIEREPSGLGGTVITYGPNGNAATVTTPSGQQTSLNYDAGGRLSSRQVTGEVPVSLSYAPGGRLSSLVDETGQTTFGYDAAARLFSSESTNGSRVSYRRDALGRIDQVRVRLDASGLEEVTQYTFDAADRLTHITDPRGGITTFAYNAAGRLTSRYLPNGLETLWTYDARDRVTSITHTSATGAVLASFVDGHEDPRLLGHRGAFLALSPDVP
jgi:YD repeat-containing protein